jgi:ribose 5-phosphate isomerase B
MKIIIGCDEIAIAMKEAIKAHLLTQDNIIIEDLFDVGVHTSEPVDYPDIAEKVALQVANKRYDRGILVCGTGIGMSIAANKIPGIRSAVIYDPYSAERAMKSNHAQIVSLGTLTMGIETAKYLISLWLKSDFAGGRSARKVEKINLIDQKYHK